MNKVLITGIRLALFMISMSGYIFFIQRKLKIQIEFIPIISIAGITLVLFMGGLLNILLVTTVFLFGIGIILLIREFYINYTNNLLHPTFTKFITPGMIIFLVASLYFVYILKNQRLIHYDNFSHWALIVKNILMNNALPNFEDAIISFNTYPPGSALYIYYFSKIVGTTEGLALIGQMFIVLTGLLALFSFSSFLIANFKGNKVLYIKKLFLTVSTLMLAFYMLNGPSTIHDLLVDTLLNTTGLALFALIYHYLDSVEKVAIPTAILVSFLMLIKNSGVFFGVIGLFLYAYGLRKYKNNAGITLLQVKPVLYIPFISPVITYYLWSKHVSMVFPKDRIGKHTMSVGAYLNTYNEKTSEEIREISGKYLKTIYKEYAYQIILIVLLLVAILFLQKLLRGYLDKRLVMLSIAIISMFVLYSVGLWAMYLVSMPTPESLRLAGYSRYLNTIIDFLVGVAIIGILYSLSQSNSASLVIITSSTIILYFISLVFLSGTKNALTVFQKKDFIMMEDEKLSVVNIDKSLTTLSPNPLRSAGEADNYYVYYPKEISESVDYEQNFLRYRLYESDVKISRDFDDIEEFWNYDYLTVTLITDEIINLFDKYSETMPKKGTYKIDKNKKIIEH